ncbi:MAG: PIN domain-containing protein [Hydrogenophaga sp.]|uniref:PIN domain-containing protein n=1 Tax=Hydrogenophaga sp. TaxID=1904254 RepID=UPI002AB91EF2|nr:PIN domain-containing protein [Hydrogenophaga sp.]MDZ4186828.1 PIN domain-containing protein [Hydrogenophaga sp.]
MILIDTNVISALWRVDPKPEVLAWVDAQTVETLFLSALTLAELRLGAGNDAARQAPRDLPRTVGARG